MVGKKKKQPDWDKMFANHVSDKGLILKLYKELPTKDIIETGQFVILKQFQKKYLPYVVYNLNKVMLTINYKLET